MSIVTNSLAVVKDDGRVLVTREDQLLRVTWFCGDSAEFSDDDLTDAIRNVDRVARLGEDVWLDLKSTTGKRFVLQLHDGDCYVNTTPSRGDSIPWSELKSALKRMMAGKD